MITDKAIVTYLPAYTYSDLDSFDTRRLQLLLHVKLKPLQNRPLTTHIHLLNISYKERYQLKPF